MFRGSSTWGAVDVEARQTLVVIGNGMMSYELCRRLVLCGAVKEALRVVVFGEEPRPAYDRVHLTELLAGKSEADLTLAPAGWYAEHGIELRVGDPVVAIDREECVARSAAGATVPYDRLVLCTGSRPFVPPIVGADLPGVFAYRTVEDLRAILRYAGGAERAAIVGGGLLGLEAARAVRALGLEVHVVEAGAWLLPRQLDAVGARLVRERMEALGVRVRTGARTARIEGSRHGAAPERVLHFHDGASLAAELVVMAAGIRPRGELAGEAGLALAPNGGVLVDDHLATADPRIFAVGECASHRGITYGLAPPGYRMIEVLVDNLVGGVATFSGADRSARLKLLGVAVASLGRPDEHDTPGSAVHTYLAGGVYRKLVIADGRIAGAVAVGEWDDLPRVEDALTDPRRFSFWDMRRFRGTGTLWLKSESPPVHEWPADALVCGCLGVRRGALTEAELAGCATVEALTARTGAGSMCGSCQPLLADYLGRQRADSLRPSQLEPAEETPPTLRCRDLPGGAASASPSSPSPARALEVTVEPRPAPRPAFDTLTSGASSVSMLAPPQLGATATPVLVDPRSSAAPALEAYAAPDSAIASQRDSALRVRAGRGPDSAPASRELLPPESHRDSMRPLVPISVPSARLSLVAPRLPPTISPAVRAEEQSRGPLLITAAAALLGALATALAPGLSAARSFRGVHAAALVEGRAFRHASGYAMVALSLAGLLLSLRKRWRRFPWGTVPGLRVAHGWLGVAALGCLWAHTGLRLGERLNRLLMLDFLALALLGGVAAAVTAIGHHLDPTAALSPQKFASRAHLVLLLPLPILVALHVLGAYYF
jgi:nitrite reductase (NADH) large subunit